MPRRHTHTRPCTHPGCTEHSHIEYTAHHELAGINPIWKCPRHAQPDRVLSADNPETTAVLVLQPSYVTRWRGDAPELVGHFWGTEGTGKGFSSIESGPGFRADASDFPPGTRLIITARIELPAETTEETP